jgi:hypothetical protein
MHEHKGGIWRAGYCNLLYVTFITNL